MWAPSLAALFQGHSQPIHPLKAHLLQSLALVPQRWDFGKSFALQVRPSATLTLESLPWDALLLGVLSLETLPLETLCLEALSLEVLCLETLPLGVLLLQVALLPTRRMFP